MEKKDMIKDYSVYELTSEEVAYAIKMYLLEEHNVPSMEDVKLSFGILDNSVSVEIVWADKEKDK